RNSKKRTTRWPRTTPQPGPSTDPSRGHSSGVERPKVVRREVSPRADPSAFPPVSDEVTGDRAGSRDVEGVDALAHRDDRPSIGGALPSRRYSWAFRPQHQGHLVESGDRLLDR